MAEKKKEPVQKRDKTGSIHEDSSKPRGQKTVRNEAPIKSPPPSPKKK